MQMKNFVNEEENSAFDYELSNDDIQRIEESIQQVKLGKTVPHEAVRAWVFSLGTNNPLPMPQSYDFK
jgi:predicted transcriptional regulator